MSAPQLSDALAQQTIDACAEYGTCTAAAKVLGLPRPTVESRLRIAKSRGFVPSGSKHQDTLDYLRSHVKRLETEIRNEKERSLTHEAIRRNILGLSEQITNTPTPPWALNTPRGHDFPGVPTLFLSDPHWGELVHPSQINGVNAYGVSEAHRRMKSLAESTVRLLSILSPKLDYPGIVIPLGGDMVSGNIHDELTASNELQTMPTLLDLFEHLSSFIGAMADTFGHVFLPCVTGNHGRDTTKIWAKDRHHTSFDWLLYGFLAKHFSKDARIVFQIPDGPDAYFKIYNHRYVLTHGDQFRGGDGMIGALGPIIRGDHKKRSRNAQIDMEYDTLLMGHWHQYMHLTRLIVNGSLKGYDEYAYTNNFPFEKPQQALWLTHPKYGITYRMPVYVEKTRTPAKTAWVSYAA